MHDAPPLPPNPFHYFVHLGSIINIPKNPKADVAYKDLVCTEQDKSYIIELVTTIAENNKFSLLLKQTYLKNIGVQINHVHPLKFLSVAVSSDFLKSCVIQIFDDYFKRNGFMDGLGPSLTREAEKGKLENYLADFSKEVSVPLENIRPYVETRDWESLVSLLTHS
ncbi:MAG TPA: hypothetical protein VLE95_08760 [Chlamydiales bacterium]|nr:hypothetical protein [Chlamydiales bacterium]